MGTVGPDEAKVQKILHVHDNIAGPSIEEEIKFLFIALIIPRESEILLDEPVFTRDKLWFMEVGSRSPIIIRRLLYMSETQGNSTVNRGVVLTGSIQIEPPLPYTSSYRGWRTLQRSSRCEFILSTMLPL